MAKENISILNRKNIKSGKLAKLIPEFYELKKVVENNDWHHKENVFDHTLSVLNNLEKALRNLNKKTEQFLNKKIDSSTRKNLLKVATLLHDIAKKETIINLNGVSRCPSHEQKGNKKAEKILRRFNFSKKEFKIITDIVRNHGLIHDIIAPDNKNFQKEYKNFKKKFSNIYLEFILMAFADTIGSYLKKTKPVEFRHRISFYENELKNLPLKSKI